jgi:hypothetical protein
VQWRWLGQYLTQGADGVVDALGKGSHLILARHGHLDGEVALRQLLRRLLRRLHNANNLPRNQRAEGDKHYQRGNQQEQQQHLARSGRRYRLLLSLFSRLLDFLNALVIVLLSRLHRLINFLERADFCHSLPVAALKGRFKLGVEQLQVASHSGRLEGHHLVDFRLSAPLFGGLVEGLTLGFVLSVHHARLVVVALHNEQHHLAIVPVDHEHMGRGW